MHIRAVPVRQGLIITRRDGEVLDRDVGAASAGTTAAERGGEGDALGHGAAEAPVVHIGEGELGRVAVLAHVAVVVLALPDPEGGGAGTVEFDVLHDDVLAMAEAAATTVGGVAVLHAWPGLEVDAVSGIVHGDVTGDERVDVFIPAVVLA